ncbi:MAG: OmpA family protein, partial [Candidatus Cloacimonetes bacterium]|nr:OmpA family protein [Candidatus Cloacimonadota bacterium]
MTQKNIDELFRSKLSDFEISKEGNWPLLNHLLKEKKAKLKFFYRIKILFYSIASLSVLSAIAFLIWNNQQTVGKHIIPTDKAKVKDSIITKEEICLKENTANENSKNNYSEELYYKPNSIKVDSDNINIKSLFVKSLNQNHTSKDNFTQNNISPTLETSSSSAYIKSESYSSFTYPPKTKIFNLGKELNSSFDDYAPIISADGSIMYFTSRRPTTEKEIIENTTSKENIYFSTFNTEDQKWTEPMLLPNPVNNSDRFNSAISLSSDGKRMFIYRDNKFGNGDIYESFLNGQSWSEPVMLPEPINSKFLETSASISPDGNTIYFVSNRKGGQGGLDIWYCSKDDEGNWRKAINMGPEINSSDNEEGVFIHPDGKTIYFSSKGHQGYGGYDIFYSKYVNNKWTKPENLGVNINTPGDDVYFVMEANGKVGYYSSIKNEGHGKKDIYRIDFASNKNGINNQSQLTTFKGVVLDKENNQPLEAEIKITDLETNKIIAKLKSNSVSGEFLVSLSLDKNYGIYVNEENYLFYSDNFNISDTASYNEITKTIYLPKLKEDYKIILNNIFFENNKTDLSKNSITELDHLYDLLIKNPALKIEISAHSDSKGSDEFNKKLSQQR